MDPYDQFPSPYTGMGNNPVNGVDPDGGLHVRLDSGPVLGNEYWNGSRFSAAGAGLRRWRCVLADLLPKQISNRKAAGLAKHKAKLPNLRQGENSLDIYVKIILDFYIYTILLSGTKNDFWQFNK
ncbi:MAG: hypothetical protein KIT80_00125 [Chitinophagaceae bacterium]|nr:hypothetical protein [Chitinophagaceae bacterium]MCW5925296.1 hypothetical protein [Chitinophagaceae bacterium]